MPRDQLRESINRAFRAGFEYGREHHEPVSPRFVSDLHPTYSSPMIDAFANGVDDGIRGDTFRLHYKPSRA